MLWVCMLAIKVSSHFDKAGVQMVHKMEVSCHATKLKLLRFHTSTTLLSNMQLQFLHNLICTDLRKKK
jgi:hypothetical protein